MYMYIFSFVSISSSHDHTAETVNREKGAKRNSSGIRIVRHFEHLFSAVTH